MQEPVLSIGPEQVIGETARIKAEGYRFVTLTCLERDETQVDILYHFDRNYQMTHLRLTVPKDKPIPSITPVYLAAFLVENEIQDLFGLRFEGLTIDYKRTFYLEEEVRAAPLCTYSVAEKIEQDSSEIPGKTNPRNPESSNP
jgi:ech hydrogenase subunit D